MSVAAGGSKTNVPAASSESETAQTTAERVCCSEGLLPENYHELFQKIAGGFEKCVDENDKVTARLAVIEFSDDALYLGLMSMYQPDSWPCIYQLCKDTADKHPDKNLFARVTDEMERACKITEVLPVRSPWMLVKTVATVVEPNYLVYRVPGVTVQPVTPQNLKDVAAYDERVMKTLRTDYLSVMTSDQGSFSRVAVERDAVCGFVLAQRLHDGSAILTHLIAEDKHVAKMLVLEAQNGFPPAASKGVVLVVPLQTEGAKPGAYNFAADLRLQGDKVSCLLFTKSALPFAYNKIFSLGGFV
ncbi:uncharacterized protein LOC144123292 [Amblyomma americanum]